MKTSLTIISTCPRELFSHYKKFSRLILCYKRIRPPCCTLFTLFTCCSLLFILSQNYLLPTISVFAQKTAYHFLLLLVGFDTLTYRKDYDRSPTLVGHQRAACSALNSSAALSPERLAPTGGDKKGPAQFGVWPDTLTSLLEQTALSEEHRSLISTVLEKISSATSGLNEAFTSLLGGFEVCNVNT